MLYSETSNRPFSLLALALVLILGAVSSASAQPTFTQAFSPSTAAVNATSTLTFTIHNAAGAPAVTGLTFINTQTAGLLIVTPRILSTNLHPEYWQGCGGINDWR